MDRMKMICIGVMVTASAVLLPMTSAAETLYVSGDVSGTWSADTVMVIGEVRVPSGAALLIQPGVEVLFSVYCKFIVDSAATLTAIGTEADSIRFDESWFWPGNGWHGLRFQSASNTSILQYCHIKNGYAWGTLGDQNGGAIHCTNSSPTIQNCLIDSCEATGSGGGIYCDPNSHPIIDGCTIIGNETWDYGGGIYCGSYSHPDISNNFIIGNTALDYGGGIYCGSFSTPQLGNNTIEGNVGSEYGGGIYCGSSSHPNITDNRVIGNSALTYGGGIYCGTSSDPDVINNVINENDAYYGAGVYCSSSSVGMISGNSFSGNNGHDGGSIYCSTYSSPVISDNSFMGNTAVDGGGIYCIDYSHPAILGNVIRGNVATDDGGGIFLSWSSPDAFELNEISLNTAADNGGGIFMIYSSPVLNKNTIASDTAGTGGGICSMSSNPVLTNCIAWGNQPQQIYQVLGSYVEATYSDIDISPVWTGIGNINDNPQFVNQGQGDYRLQWGSPCIDSGDPNPIYNDPDGTRADMGAYYYDQSVPLRLLLTPISPPIEILAAGDTFSYVIQVTNIAPVTINVNVWCDITLPGGSSYGPILGPVGVSVASGATLSRVRSQNVPGGAPPGLYYMNGYSSFGSITSTDSFPFVKLGSSGDSWQTDWLNGGESFETEYSSANDDADFASKFTLSGAFPNPFNPTTLISYSLPDAGQIQLSVFDATGRLVATLVNGWREAGAHEVTFDGSNLASGVYICRMETGNFTTSGKMVLMK